MIALEIFDGLDLEAEDAIGNTNGQEGREYLAPGLNFVAVYTFTALALYILI